MNELNQIHHITKWSANPSWGLYAAKEVDILSARDQLFDEIGNVSREFSVVAQRIFYDKLGSSATPLMGELMPWVLIDIGQLDKRLAKRVSVGWLSLYLYTILVDLQVDEKGREIDPKEILTGSLLLEKGLSSLFGMTASTRYAEITQSALEEALKWQICDVNEQAGIHNLKNKIRYSAGKNKILVALASTLAASQNSDFSEIIYFTDELLLSLQYLDDLCDLEADFRNNNLTVLHSISPTIPGTISNHEIPRADILRDLIASGAIRQILQEVHTSLSLALSNVEKSNAAIIHTDAYEFFHNLLFEVDVLLALLKDIDSSVPLEKDIIQRIDEAIKVVAQSS